MIAVINAHMIGAKSEPGEHVDWNSPDLFTEEEFVSLIEESVEDYAEQAPHMIVWEYEEPTSATEVATLPRYLRRAAIKCVIFSDLATRLSPREIDEVGDHIADMLDAADDEAGHS